MSTKGLGSNEGPDCSQVIEIHGSARVAVHLPRRSILGTVLASQIGSGFFNLSTQMCCTLELVLTFSRSRLGTGSPDVHHWSLCPPVG